MKVLVYGSMNIDRTYTVSHFVREGETLTTERMELFCGGKGLNQAVALSRAGMRTVMAGAIGEDGDFLLEPLKAEGVDLTHVKRTDGVSGHAVIQINDKGNNCIIVYPGANGTISHDDVDETLSFFDAGDWLVLQNEISSLDYILQIAKQKGMTIALNPSPLNVNLNCCDFACADYLMVNEIEGAEIAHLPESASFDEILGSLRARFPKTNILMTLGHRGSVFEDCVGNRSECGIYQTNVVDTTAAGDCFTGFFLAELITGKPASDALKTAAIASGIGVSRKGAIPSIPRRREFDTVDRNMIPDLYTR